MLKASRVEKLTIIYDASLSWAERIHRGAPDTCNYHVIRTLGLDRSPALAGDREVIIAAFDSTLTSEVIAAWGLSQALDPLFAHESLAIGEAYPELPARLGKRMIGLTALRTLTHEDRRVVCTMWWYCPSTGTPYERIAFLTNSEGGEWSKDYWHCFTPIAP